jgi:hypothetical protein
MGEWMYRSAFSWPRHKLELSGQLHAPAALPPGKEPPVPIGEEGRWTPEPVWTTWRRENSWPYGDSNSDPSVVQPVASRYTDYAIPAPDRDVSSKNNNKKFRNSSLVMRTGINLFKRRSHWRNFVSILRPNSQQLDVKSAMTDIFRRFRVSLFFYSYFPIRTLAWQKHWVLFSFHSLQAEPANTKIFSLL